MKIKLSTIRYLRSEFHPDSIGPCAGEVAFVGRSNVGKSSVLNAICGQKIARVSQTPGCTRAINIFGLVNGSWLIDLPGYGYAVGPLKQKQAWGPMIERYLTIRENLRAVWVLMDGKVGPMPMDIQMVGWLRHNGLTFHVVVNKLDKVPPAQREDRKKEIATTLEVPVEDIFWVSAFKGNGIPALTRAVEAALQ